MQSTTTLGSTAKKNYANSLKRASRQIYAIYAFYALQRLMYGAVKKFMRPVFGSHTWIKISKTQA